MVLPVLPNPALLTVEALLAQPGVTALVDDRVYTAFPDYQLWPMIIVEVVDVIELVSAHGASTRIQVNCWGQGQSSDDEAEANLMARTIQANARDLRGTYSSGVISNAAPAGISPEPDNGWWRYVIDLIVEYHTL